MGLCLGLYNAENGVLFLFGVLCSWGFTYFGLWCCGFGLVFCDPLVAGVWWCAAGLMFVILLLWCFGCRLVCFYFVGFISLRLLC